MEVSGASLVIGDLCIAVIEDDGGYEAPFDEREANAARLAHCWNTHDKMREALERLVAETRHGAPSLGTWEKSNQALADSKEGK